MNFTLQQLGLAYRKAKVDIYYSTNPNLAAIADYEEQLLENLASLLARLSGEEENWVSDPNFLGGWAVATKEIKLPQLTPQNTGVIYSSPDDEWEQVYKHSTNDRPKAEFRLMADVSLDFHVLSALWMLEVGHLYDKKLGRSAYGNRLRRTAAGKINRYALGSFVPYLAPFRRWRDGGIETMRDAIEAGKKIVALTADVSSFYHELNPGFMLNPDFVSAIGVELTEDQEKLHRLFIRALEAWSVSTPLKKGLPVGLPASAVVANVALFELDEAISREVMPLYYGRYVDDIILVMDNGAKFKTPKELWNWLFVRVKSLNWADKEERAIKFSPNYLLDSNIRFGNDKNKVFLLSGESGKILVDSIMHQIRERASEWRALPNLPLEAIHVGTDLVKATQDDGETVDNLRKTDSLTMRRSSFAMKLRDFEAYERDLAPSSWSEHRHAFFRAFIQHVIVLPQFFTLATYVPRVVKLATACEDFQYLLKIVIKVKQVAAEVSDSCDIAIKSCSPQNVPAADEISGRWRQNLYRSIEENILAAFPPELSSKGKKAWLEVNAEIAAALNSTSLLSISTIRGIHARLFSCDLAHMPFRFIGLPEEMVFQRGVPNKGSIKKIGDGISLLIPDEILSGVNELSRISNIDQVHPRGFIFPVRPFGLAELCIIIEDPFNSAQFEKLQSMVLATRGFSLSDKMPKFDKAGVLNILGTDASMNFKIAVSSWNTRHESWIAAVMRADDPDTERYARLAQLANSVMSSGKRARYFVLPELAMPAKWFMRISQKLRRCNISLITGIEYLHARRARVHNQIWASFSHTGLGFPSTIIYRQDKQKPALHEEQELTRLNGLSMKAFKMWKNPPIIQHGNFRFSMLVCSELTNISYRTHLRGKVDALFVPEWNQDTETFNALVESAALDIHAYIIQCNDRRYGDSRIRAPFKDGWRRDILRVKGGTEDYCVCGEINVEVLRRFQSSHRSPTKDFKPVPDGFVIEYKRKLLPG